MGDEKKQIAILIDADNVEHKHIDNIMTKVTSYGNPIIRRIYGDWGNSQLKNWRVVLKELAFIEVQVTPNSKFKNATDISLVIEAMDILTERNVDVFCIVSSDSDYTKLSLRLKESNKMVIGFGDKNKSNKAFVNSCDEYIYYDTLSTKYKNDGEKVETKKLNRRELRMETKLLNTIRAVIEELSIDNEGKLNLGEVKKRIVSIIPDFDTVNYGYKKFSDLIETFEYWEIDKRKLNILISN